MCTYEQALWDGPISSGYTLNEAIITFPGGSLMCHLFSTSFGYPSGYPGEVIVPVGAVRVVTGPVE